VQGSSRLEAARAFFDLLVLQSKGLAALQQQQPYGDIAVVVAA
jgi:chromatin segregation and condensation protein Rec8/ScpA/Scc1 (kleisin family)